MPSDEKTIQHLRTIGAVLKRADLSFPPRSKRSMFRMLAVIKHLPRAIITANLWRAALGFALFTIPAFFFTAGYYQARNVLVGRQFEYSEPLVFRQDTVLAGDPYFKYLGRAGDYLFLLMPDNQRRIVIGKDQ